jgi:Flp pilus assembly pilin Flp
MDRLLEMYMRSRELLTREDGQDLVEYALLVAIVALGSISAIGYVTTALVAMFTNISNSVG